jgi:hypothetical protein
VPCRAQTGNLTFATAITLVLVPMIYAMFVLDLKIVSWNASNAWVRLCPTRSRNSRRTFDSRIANQMCNHVSSYADAC